MLGPFRALPYSSKKDLNMKKLLVIAAMVGCIGMLSDKASAWDITIQNDAKTAMKFKT